MKLLDIKQLLNDTSYPGRGIILGRSADNTRAVIAYFIMGRSENSRNRVFTETEDGIRTEAYDPAKLSDPSLIIYHPVRVLDNGITIVHDGPDAPRTAAMATITATSPNEITVGDTQATSVAQMLATLTSHLSG